MNDDDLVKRLRSCSSDEAMWSREAANRIEQLTSGPGGIMEMKQTISDKEQEIEQLHVALREITMLNNQRDRFSSQIDFIISQILNGKKDD
jgi:hypothetical protein